MSNSLVRYGDFTVEEAEEQEKESQDSRGSSRFLKLSTGKNVVRVLPPLPGKKWARIFFKHNVDVPGVGRVYFTCPRYEKKEPCVVCTQESRLMSTGNDHDAKKAKKIKAKRRVLCNAIHRSHEEDGPKVWEFGSMVEDQLIAMRKDEDMGGNFVDPVNGIDLLVVKSVGDTQMDTEYKVVPANKGKSCPLHEDIVKMNEWISGQSNLDRQVRVYDADDIERILKGEKPRGRSDDEESGNPARGGRASRNASEEMEGQGSFIDD